jgi:hypothetical protein
MFKDTKMEILDTSALTVIKTIYVNVQPPSLPIKA